MKLNCAKCGYEVYLKQKKDLPPIGRCKKCGEYVVAYPMLLSNQKTIAEFEGKRK